jgi:hypothetical protein
MTKLINWTFELRQRVGRVQFVRARRTKGGRYIEELDKLPEEVRMFLMLKPGTRILDGIRYARTLDGFKFTHGTCGTLKADVDFSDKPHRINKRKALAGLKAILSDNGSALTVAAVYRSIYKHTACGPWLSAIKHDGNYVTCSNLGELKLEEVAALQIGSIVEGSEATVEGDILYLDSLPPTKLVKEFNRQLEAVNDEACALWDEANGEEQQTPQQNGWVGKDGKP